MRLWWVPPEFNALQHFQPMGSAICLSADRERALRETPAALSLSATEDLSRLGAIIILALKARLLLRVECFAVRCIRTFRASRGVEEGWKDYKGILYESKREREKVLKRRESRPTSPNAHPLAHGLVAGPLTGRADFSLPSAPSPSSTEDLPAWRLASCCKVPTPNQMKRLP